MNVDVLHVGDRMRMSVEFVDTLKARPADDTVLVRVKSIERQLDGTLVVWMENAADESHMIWRQDVEAEK